jgi:hypothetical protein
VSTRVVVNTYTHSVTYVTDKMLRSLRYIITEAGLDPCKFLDDWESTEYAARTWLGSGYLRKVVLEIYDSKTEKLVSRWDFDIDYDYGSDGDGSMWADTDAIRFAIRKCGVIPYSCSYRILMDNAPGRPDVPGWGPASYRSTDGFVRQSIGTTIGTNAIGTNSAYWRRS